MILVWALPLLLLLLLLLPGAPSSSPRPLSLKAKKVAIEKKTIPIRQAPIIKRGRKQKLLPFHRLPVEKWGGVIRPTRKVRSSLLSFLSSFQCSTQWEHAGIQGIGVFSSVDYDKGNPKNLLAGTEGSGLYRSYNYAQSWEKLDFPSPFIWRVLIDKDNASHYLVLASNSWNVDNSWPTILLYESMNAGQSWTSVIPWAEDTMGNKLEIIPQDFTYVKGTLTLTGGVVGQEHVAVIAQKEGMISDGNPFLIRFLTTDKTVNTSQSNLLKIKETGYGLKKFAELSAEGQQVIGRLYLTKDYGKTWQLTFDTAAAGFTTSSNGYRSGYDISSSGEVIIFASETGKMAKSVSGGESWQFFNNTISGGSGGSSFLSTSQTAVVQDLVMTGQDSLALFGYGLGLLESFDGGQTFKNVEDYPETKFVNFDIFESEVIYETELPPGKVSFIIKPADLRLDAMRVIGTKNTLWESSPTFLLPTDQGLFSYNSASKVMTNMAPSLYLGDSGTVSVTSCPRIYTGLWHVGSYWVNSDGTIELRTGESYGYGIGEEMGCESPAFNAVHGYFYDGIHLDEDKTVWFKKKIDLGWPIAETPSYLKGWWYLLIDKPGNKYSLLRINDAFTSYETLFDDDDKESNSPIAYGLRMGEEEAAEGTAIVPDLWIVDTNKKLWATTNGIEWSLQYNFNFSGETLKKAIETTKGIFIKGALIILYGNQGMVIGNLGGNQEGGPTWSVVPSLSYCSAVVPDTCGTLYAACAGGVYFSKEGGQIFTKFGSGDEKSLITGLAIDNKNQILYAATRGESLLKLNICDCPEP